MQIGDAVMVDDVNEDSFRKAAHEIGLGEKLALKRLSAMREKFEAALNATAEELAIQGFSNALQLRDQILLTGGCS